MHRCSAKACRKNPGRRPFYGWDGIVKGDLELGWKDVDCIPLAEDGHQRGVL
jgi:hypothetical protein